MMLTIGQARLSQHASGTIQVEGLVGACRQTDLWVVSHGVARLVLRKLAHTCEREDRDAANSLADVEALTLTIV